MRRVSAFLRRHLLTILGALVLLAVVMALWIFSAPMAQWNRPAQPPDVVAFLAKHLLAVAMVGGCLLVLVLIGLPKWQAARPDLTTKERFEVENDARKTLAEIAAGAALLVGLYFTWSSLEVNREGQVTERFTKAIEQLGAVNAQGERQLEIRLGGIYALERIARDSARDHWPIMEVLTVYVRERAAWPPKDTLPGQDHQSGAETPSARNRSPSPKPAADIQAILTVVGRRTRVSRERVDQRLDLAHTDLRGADLEGAHLERAFLRGAHLEGASLHFAYLEGADLEGAHLERATLQSTNLEGADLREAHLEQAYLPFANLKAAFLRDARLERAYLLGANLQGASLRGVHLGQATGLTVEQLCAVLTLYEAQLDPSLMEQIRQQCPKLLEEPQE
jgi:hypothetical protein